MDQILKQIKTDLKEICKTETFKTKHYNHSKQEILEYQEFFNINRKKHNLTMRFIIQKQENSLSFTYRVVCSVKNLEIDKLYSFADKENDTLPGINPVDRERLRELYNYVVKDNVIVNEVDIKTQYQAIVDIFKKNYKSIIEYTKALPKTKKNPE